MEFTIEQLKIWIKETIEINNLKALFLIWDEFSDYFKNNRTRLDALQQLAELTNATPFALVIVTHFSGAIFSDNDQTAKKVIDRFKVQEIKLPESIAFQLIGHAITVREEFKEEWYEYSEDLNSRIPEARHFISQKIEGCDEEYLKKILPLHPYAALALMNIAKLFDSNQRSMFKFIVEEDPQIHAFQWFIKNFSPENKDILSIDMLWDYFYAASKNSEGSRSLLDQEVRRILLLFDQMAEKLDDSEKKAMKTVLIFQALSKKLNNLAIFKATNNNLEFAFEGIDELENGQGISILNHFVDLRLLFIDNETFQAPLDAGPDIAKIEKIEKELQKTTKCRNLINFNYNDIFNFGQALEKRFIFKLTTVDDFLKDLNRLSEEDNHNYQIKTLIVINNNEENQFISQQKIKKALQNEKTKSINFIDNSDSFLDKEKINEWISYTAKASYFLSKDKAQARNAQEQANKIINDWSVAISNGKFTFWSQKHPEGLNCSGRDKIKDLLQVTVMSNYPFCFDFTEGLSEILFNTPNQTSILAGLCGGKENVGGSRKTFVISTDHEKKLLGEAQHVESYWIKFPELRISKLKKDLDALIKNEFEAGGTGKISIREIVDHLIAKGFMPNNLSAFLTGFLLKEYASSSYLYSDANGKSDAMSLDKMQELIHNYFRNLSNTFPKYKDQYIEILTEEQRAFADMAKKLFKIEKYESIELIAAQITEQIKKFRYPLWCFKALPESEGYEEYIDNFTKLLNPHNSVDSSTNTIATKIGKLIIDHPEDIDHLSSIFTKDNAEIAMRLWLESFENGKFIALVNKIQVEDMLNDVRARFSDDGLWLWNESTGIESIKELMIEYKIIDITNNAGIGTNSKSFAQCMETWKNWTKNVRIPYEDLNIKFKELNPFTTLLLDIANNNYLNISKKKIEFLDIINSKIDKITSIYKDRVLIFQDIYKEQLKDLSQDEINDIYKELNLTSFTSNRIDFECILNEKITNHQKDQVKNKLVELWKQKTNSEDPEDWSNKHNIPVLNIVPAQYYSIMKEACEIIIKNNRSFSSIQKTYDFLKNNNEIFSILSQKNLQDIFYNDILGKNKVLVKYNDILHWLKRELGEKIYYWTDDPRLKKAINTWAQQTYQKHCANALIEQIDKMSPDKAKEYLKNLIVQKFEVGIQILQEKVDE